MAFFAKDLAKTEGVLLAQPDDSLASALAKMHSSHDAVFVKDKDKLLGVISPYHVLFRSAHPGSTKIKNCLFSPPRLKPDARVDEIARLMIQSKIYFLPVITPAGKWLGVVSYRRLLRLNKNLDLRAKLKPPVTVKEAVSIGQARNLMKLSRVSRLIVVNPSGRLAGILTRHDLNNALGRPSGEKNQLLNRPVKAYIKRSVVTANRRAPANQLIDLMLDKRIGSVVLIDGQYRPTGLVSVRDCLDSLTKTSGTQTRVTLQFPNQFRFGQSVIDLVNRWRVSLVNRPLLKFDLKLNQHTNAANLVSGYKVLLQAKPAHEKEVVAKGSARDWKLALQKGLGRLKKQLRKK